MYISYIYLLFSPCMPIGKNKENTCTISISLIVNNSYSYSSKLKIKIEMKSITIFLIAFFLHEMTIGQNNKR